MKTNNFDLNMTNEDKEINLECHFIKHNKITPLYMTCQYNYNFGFTIKQMQFSLNDLHYKYN